MDKSHMDKTNFIPLLPADSLYPPFSYEKYQEAALEKIVSDLNYLLYAPFKQFWTTLLYNPSLKHCISSLLSFMHRRWLNSYVNSKLSPEQFDEDEDNNRHFRIVKDGSIFECIEGIDQVLLLLFHRIVNFNNENKELSIFYKLGDEIISRFILDIPRLLELCEIFGERNGAIVKHIVKGFTITKGPDFYQELSGDIMPILFKKVNETIRRLKDQTGRE